MGVGIDAYRYSVFGENVKILPVRIKIAERFVPAVCIKLEGNIMDLEG